jgi:arsenate reductase
MAAAFFNVVANPTKARALSAGTQPARSIHPEVQAVMMECGVDLQDGQPRLLTPEMARSASMLITMGCGDACPAVAGPIRADWPLPDPKGQPVEQVRKIRDEIRCRVAALVAHLGVS